MIASPGLDRPAPSTLPGLRLAALLAVPTLLLAGTLSGLIGTRSATFVIFLLATAGWTLSRLAEVQVALLAAVALVACGASRPGQLYAALGDSTTWLMLGSFVLAASIKATGWDAALAWRIVSRARSARQLLFFIAGAIFVTAFFVPATTARAALAWPIYTTLRQQLANPGLVRALGLVIPATVLLSAFASLTGAGAHLVTADLIRRATGTPVTYLHWLWWGAPFALASCALAVWVISRLFLSPAECREAVHLRPPEAVTHPRRRRVALIVLGVMALWCTESWHGCPAAVVALAGALFVTLPGVGPLSLEDALREVQWSLLLFLAATLVLSDALVEAGGLQGALQRALGELKPGDAPVAALAVATLSLLAHLVIHSRTARSSILVPLLLAAAPGLGLQPTALALLSTAAAGYCLTLPVSAKPVAMYSGLDGGFSAPDLLRLSAVLVPAHLLLLIVFAFWIWPAQGLSLFISQAR